MSRFTYKSLDSKKSSVTKYTAHKSWTITDETAETYGVYAYTGSYRSSSFNIGDPLDTSAAAERINNGKYDRLVFDSIHHLYYSNPYNSYISGDSEFAGEQHRELLPFVEVFSIPTNIFGDRIKPGSVTLEAATADYYDDSYGNLISSAELPKGSPITNYPPTPSNTLVYLTFDEEWKHPSGSIISGKLKSSGENLNIYPKASNVKIGEGRLIRHVNLHSGYPNDYSEFRAGFLSGSLSDVTGSENVIEIENTIGLDNWNRDFAISMWINIPDTQPHSVDRNGPYDPSTGIRKMGSVTRNVIATSRGFIDNQQHDNIIPWEISIGNSLDPKPGTIYASRGIYGNITTLTSSTHHNTGSVDGFPMWRHITFQKTGSNLELYIGSGSQKFTSTNTWNASVDITSSVVTALDPLTDNRVTSHTNICLGAQRFGFKQIIEGSRDSGIPTKTVNPNYSANFRGGYDEFIVYNKALTKKQIYNKHYFKSHPYAGNIFYNHGMVTITNGMFDGNALPIQSDFTLGFKGSHDLTVHSFQCTIENGEYNMTLNPSARQGQTLNSERPKGFVTSSDFTPYITSIGLYNDRNELLAIGKLPQAVRSPKDFDITFIVQFDT